MDDFIPVYESNASPFPDHLICKHCGKKVERGIISISHHWLHCENRTEGLIVAKNEWEKKLFDSWSINVKHN